MQHRETRMVYKSYTVIRPACFGTFVKAGLPSERMRVVPKAECTRKKKQCREENTRRRCQRRILNGHQLTRVATEDKKEIECYI